VRRPPSVTARKDFVIDEMSLVFGSVHIKQGASMVHRASIFLRLGYLL